MEALAELDVRTSNPAASPPRVELVDRRLWVELVSLPPAEAAALATALGESARAANRGE